jgi:hypothetical protein
MKKLIALAAAGILSLSFAYAQDAAKTTETKSTTTTTETKKEDGKMTEKKASKKHHKKAAKKAAEPKMGTEAKTDSAAPKTN